MIGRYGQINKMVPALAPVDLATSGGNSIPVNMANAHRCTFLAHFGVITGSSTTVPVVTLMVATGAATTGATAITFNYRLSGAVGTDSWGAVTAATTAGKSLTLTSDGMVLLVDVDPSLVAGVTDGKYVYLHIATGATVSVCLAQVMAEIEPRYAATNTDSAT